MGVKNLIKKEREREKEIEKSFRKKQENIIRKPKKRRGNTTLYIFLYTF
jgi:hypothetical protein